MARNIDDIQLPSEILSSIPEKKLTTRKLDALASVLKSKREEAMKARKASGIEETWQLCEEAYAGIDDANRSEYTTGKWIKPTVLAAPITTSGSPKGSEDKRSTAFVRLTTRYVDAGAAKIGEILLPIDDKAFSFDPTPVPALVKGKADLTPVRYQGQMLQREARPDEYPPATAYGVAHITAPSETPPVETAPGQPKMVPLTTKDLAEEALQIAKERAKKAENRIFDWMVECQHHREMRKVIFDAARLGVGVLKGPFPDKRRTMATSWVKDENGKKKLALQIHEEIVPCDRWRDPWNIFPDPGCGEDIANGDHIFDRDFLSEKKLRDLKGLPGYLDDQIDQAIKIGPARSKSEGRNPNELENKYQYEVWYYYGTISREDFESINPNASKSLDKNAKDVYAIVTIVNDIVIRASINPLDSGKIPYHAVPWQRRTGYWAGVGVSEQISVPQRIVNASTRALLNNAGISAGPQIIINQTAVRPANNEWVVTPNKIWYASQDGVMEDVRKAFVSFNVTNTGEQLMRVIEYGMKLGEESTSIPLVTQGMSGPTTPETLGATQLQNNNANQLLRNIGYTFDDYITEPLVTMFYEYLLLDPNVPEDEKGDLKINAHGSIAMVERSIQDQTIAQMTPLATNPVFGVNPKKWFAILAQSKHLDPRMFQYTADEQAKIDATPQPPPPAVQVAQIKAQVDQAHMQLEQKLAQDEAALAREIAQLEIQSAQAIEQLRNETAKLRSKLDTDRDTAYVNAEASRAQASFTQKMEELKLKRELAIMDYASKHQTTLDQVKAKLADTAMKLRVQKELAAAETSLEVHKHRTPSAESVMKPPSGQTPGRAKRSFTQI